MVLYKIISFSYGNRLDPIVDVHCSCIKKNTKADHIFISKDVPEYTEQEFASFLRERSRWLMTKSSLRYPVWIYALLNDCLNEQARRIRETDVPIVLADLDTLFFHDVGHVFEKDFDIAFTTDTGNSGGRVNTGVVFVRNTEASNAFFKMWVDIDNRMLVDADYFNYVAGVCGEGAWKGGWNQRSLFMLLANGGFTAKLLFLPCYIYNCHGKVWEKFDEKKTCVLHIMNETVRAIIGEKKKKFHPSLRKVLFPYFK
jgi:hypothetical protein